MSSVMADCVHHLEWSEGRPDSQSDVTTMCAGGRLQMTGISDWVGRVRQTVFSSVWVGGPSGGRRWGRPSGGSPDENEK